MKKYFVFAAAAIAALASCSKTEPDVTTVANEEISFQVANYAAQTKANSAYSTTVPFGTYAWFSEGTPDPATDQVFMNNQKVSNQAATTATPSLNATPANVWKAEGATYYWPRTGSLAFVSYSPFAKSDKVTVTASKITVANYSAIDDITITNANSASEQALLLVADKVSGVDGTTNTNGSSIISGTNTNNYAGVPTLFRNTLAKLSFKIAAAPGIKAEITNVALSGVKTVGGVEMTPNTDGKWAPATTAMTVNGTNGPETANVSVWTPAATLNTATQYAYTEASIIASKPLNADDQTADVTAVCANAKNIVVIPQTLAKTTYKADNSVDVLGQTITITAKVTVKLPQGGTYSYTTSFEGNLYSDTLPAWEINKHITYTVTIAQGGEVTFDPAVAEFEELDGVATALEKK